MRQRSGLIVAALVAAAFLAFLFWPTTAEPTRSTPTAQVSLPVGDSKAAAAAGVDAVNPTLASTVPQADCRSGRLVLSTDYGQQIKACAEPAVASQNGGARRYSYGFGEDGSGSLTIETLAGTVVRVEAGLGGLRYACADQTCIGIRFGRPDFNGVQTVDLRGTVLTSTESSGNQRLSIDASLSALGNVTAVCDTGVTLNFNDNSYTRFCAFGGNGFARGEDGLPIHVFRDLDGGSIEVATNEKAEIRRVELSSEGLSCEAAGCAGSSFLPPDKADNRIMQFIGTELRSADGERSVVLNGSLVLSGD